MVCILCDAICGTVFASLISLSLTFSSSWVSTVASQSEIRGLTFYLPMHANAITAVSAEINGHAPRVYVRCKFSSSAFEMPLNAPPINAIPMILILCTPENPNSSVAKKQELPYSHTKFLDFQGFCKEPPDIVGNG
ncbi:hypothetical protein F4776DRAFT_327818 [Hypoxylon sp. NC0597]|nr:hypothetical protein F4776DRAFT_327818 [Hypoxylon sp. NC0597]